MKGERKPPKLRQTISKVENEGSRQKKICHKKGWSSFTVQQEPNSGQLVPQLDLWMTSGTLKLHYPSLFYLMRTVACFTAAGFRCNPRESE